MTVRLAVVTSVWDAAQAADSALEFAVRTPQRVSRPTVAEAVDRASQPWTRCDLLLGKEEGTRNLSSPSTVSPTSPHCPKPPGMRGTRRRPTHAGLQGGGAGVGGRVTGLCRAGGGEQPAPRKKARCAPVSRVRMSAFTCPVHSHPRLLKSKQLNYAQNPGPQRHEPHCRGPAATHGWGGHAGRLRRRTLCRLRRLRGAGLARRDSHTSPHRQRPRLCEPGLTAVLRKRT